MSEVLVWFDGGCPLCRREIALMRWLDRRGAIRFIDVSADDAVPMADAGAGGAGCPVGRAALLARFHASEDGAVLDGAAAFAAMWRAIPVLRPLGLAARNRTVLAGLERIYGAFLLVRPRLQRAAAGIERRRRRSGTDG